jgi:hypothetical protein
MRRAAPKSPQHILILDPGPPDVVMKSPMDCTPRGTSRTMKRLGIAWINYLVAGALVCAGAGSADAQWAITGTTPGGGNVVSGTGCAGR